MKYIHRRSNRAKNISLTINSLLQVVITSPRYCPKTKIEQFINSQKSWIKQRIKQLKSIRNNIETADHIKIFGQDYKKIKKYFTDKTIGITIQDQQIIFNYLPQQLANSDFIKKEKILFLKKTSRHYLNNRIANLAKIMSLPYHSIKIRNQKTRWGSCSNKNNINLNWRLVHYSTSIIDYVLIHELAHLKHHNHSKKFWKLVAQYDPNYKIHQKYLRKQAVTLL
ncbi:MAG: SprT family zinc-dependent metalloprotease [Patescibacteria group bacterium]|nr:SprT family zinc-dependent metalloprotease [Patescibacteria group bacterium]